MTSVRIISTILIVKPEVVHARPKHAGDWNNLVCTQINIVICTGLVLDSYSNDILLYVWNSVCYIREKQSRKLLRIGLEEDILAYEGGTNWKTEKTPHCGAMWFSLVARYCTGDQFIQGLGGRTWGERLLGRSKRRRNDNVRMNLK
jgi:hypothetical protein